MKIQHGTKAEAKALLFIPAADVEPLWESMIVPIQHHYLVRLRHLAGWIQENRWS
jgi:hypothetical protein